ncbi:MAG: preprotein translocase subunit SecA [Alphaproteobacteria bacterium RIFCSPHIGHO2_01_FULL_41_14]|nr:MAG: preprotein translocase subunit SecA [Alphaproteobacteria bacterium GWB1_45_5]OFW76118.1 MAG: preprotein translocase subunit SecA [Alphaproteobacteria bacterium GWA1_45_9]OFW90228.1 MAG: preprotein translocase subunit SecA [Alphaproteobacteria bacterium RIFCSPHIGHO2_01_FULL_41_14]
MLKTLLQKVFGSSNERVVKKLYLTVTQINGFEPLLSSLSDEELRAQTDKFRTKLREGASLQDILPEAFATVREAAKRTLGHRHYDVQLMGGMILHQGQIVEMKTGEGKTLVATLPIYLNALEGKGVHLVTINDYLAERDTAWMGRIYRFLGLTVSCITNNMSDEARREAYKADITYVTNNELGFDYLRDNMKFRLEEMVQRPFNYAIVDEVDSILIDEARTPLIISGAAEDSSALYVSVNKVVSQLKAEDYEKDEKQNNVTLTEKGVEKVEELLRKAGLLTSASLYDLQNISLVHHVNQALKAHTLFQKEKDYIIKDMKIVLIDEFTGRMMDGRRFSDGLHQALEAKEDVPVQMENQTLASITFQNYFRMYPKLAGMTGTAMTEALEFEETYGLQCFDLPTHEPCVRKDRDDEVYRTEREKFAAVVDVVKDCQSRQQPVLVGTASIEKSEQFSQELKKHKIPHNVLNARYHDKEALIIADAGRPGNVTIATNMAGRGTDIKLGGNLEARTALELGSMEDGPAKIKAMQKIKEDIQKDAEKVLASGGLYVIGTERHESRRIDNQLRGRSGRQGDPGASKFFLSLEDDLMRIFGSERLDSMLVKLGLKEGEAITHPWINKALEKAQGKVEARNYDMRKHLLKYDNVMNEQRKAVYELRRDLMQDVDVSEMLQGMREDVVSQLITSCIPPKAYPSDWNISGLHEEVRRIFDLELPVAEWASEEGIADQEIKKRLETEIEKQIQHKLSGVDGEMLKTLQKSVLLRLLDQHWKDHLLSLDHMRQGVNLRAYAQRDPLNEYKHEAFKMFEAMLERLKENIISVLCHFRFEPEDLLNVMPEGPARMHETRQDPALQNQQKGQGGQDSMVEFNPSDSSTWGQLPRNVPCPCGSGKKYKYCHGKLN